MLMQKAGNGRFLNPKKKKCNGDAGGIHESELSFKLKYFRKINILWGHFPIKLPLYII